MLTNCLTAQPEGSGSGGKGVGGFLVGAGFPRPPCSLAQTIAHLRFASSADVLVRECGRLPKASDLGVADELLDRVLARPDLTEIFMRGLQTTLGSNGREAAGYLFKQDRRLLTLSPPPRWAVAA